MWRALAALRRAAAAAAAPPRLTWRAPRRCPTTSAGPSSRRRAAGTRRSPSASLAALPTTGRPLSRIASHARPLSAPCALSSTTRLLSLKRRPQPDLPPHPSLALVDQMVPPLLLLLRRMRAQLLFLLFLLQRRRLQERSPSTSPAAVLPRPSNTKSSPLHLLPPPQPRHRKSATAQSHWEIL